MMETFINECSLDEQFDPYNIDDSFRTFIRILDSINKFDKKAIFKSTVFFNFKAIKNTHIETSLKDNFQLNSVFSQNLRSAVCWEDNQIHSLDSSYIYNKEEFVTTSVAEITERKINNPLINALLINFVDSKFSDQLCIDVKKDSNVPTNIDCVFDETSIHEWLISNGFIDPNAEYDDSLGLPPLDRQTVLLKTDKFELTPWRNGKHGRRVYRLKGTNQLWAVDGSLRHATKKAHIEVFDEPTQLHLGTSIYNDIKLDDKYKKKRRTISLVK